jgi:uncharacterized protein (TIGR02145 family)
MSVIKVIRTVTMIAVSALMLIPVLSNAQTMNIHKKDNSVISVPVSEIDRITYDGSGQVQAQPVAGGVDTVTDIDGNVYKTVRIGSQTWMAEDLRVTKFNDGAMIPLVETEDNWKVLESAAYCWYDNKKTDPRGTFGVLYNGFTVERGYLCPSGWRVPTVEDWDMLFKECGSAGLAGSKLKASGSSYWDVSNSTSTNDYGFSAFGTGYRTSQGKFNFRGGTGIWWTSTSATYSNNSTIAMYFNIASAVKGSFPKGQGACVRCVKDGF